jgi:hypothetical protein
MRRWIVVLVVLGALAPAASSQAGTYDVVSCGAPGAGGVNRAWTNDIAGDPANFTASNCGSELLGATASNGGTASTFQGVNWTFTAPAGTQVSKLVTWRYLQGYCCNGWSVAAYDGLGRVLGGLGGEACVPPQSFEPCRVGAAGVNASSRAEYANINASKVFYSAGCGQASCATDNDSGQRYAEFHLYGTVVTVTDTTAPAVKLSGPLTAPGWRRPGDPQQLAYSATDGSGIRRLALTGASTQGGDRACDYTRPAPCSNASGTLTTALGDGVHTLTVTATDAGGNATPVTRTVRIDGTSPGARVAVARGKRIVVEVGDNVSGVASGAIAVRRTSRQPFRALKTKLRKGRLSARVGRGGAGRSDIRVTLTDVAGNRFEGLGTKLKMSRVRPRFGRALRIRGRLSLVRGKSVRGANVSATSTIARGGARTVRLGSARTGRTGRFSLRLPAGPSRVVRLSSPSAGGLTGASARVRVRVPASSTIRASRSSLSGAGRVRFSGRIRTLGQPLPGRGLLVALQGFDRGAWHTFADTRTDGRGRWSASNAFSGRPGTFPVRLRIRRQSRFPFALGYSRVVRVTVR